MPHIHAHCLPAPLAHQIVAKYPANALQHRKLVCEYVSAQKIRSVQQLEAALSHMAKVGSDATVNVAEFEAACGVGVTVTAEQVAAAVTSIVAKNKEMLLEERYHANVGKLLAEARTIHPWADTKMIKEETDRQIEALLGPRTAADDEPKKKKKVEKKPKEAAPAAAATADGGDNAAAAAGEGEGVAEDADPFSFFPSPENNHQVHTVIPFSDGTIMRPANTKEMLAAHLQRTGGKVVTRFPPEPNGYLHIGHAKAMHIDFGYAKERGGICYLRYDDTNPEAEKQEYIDHIQEIVAWLGWKWCKITYSSDYFQELYDLAVELIKRDKAYVCHQTADEIKEYREKKMDSPWRNRPVEESLRLFNDMRRGLVPEGAATLRMKQDMRNENYNMLDLIAYRIKFVPHPMAGDKWCIYPSYDYTHCIVDALEDVTHSLCTLEFETRRASYYWLIHSLDLYLPVVWEYSRLNITHTVLSKRKLNKLVTDHHVRGWDDPRLLTLSGLRRRGCPPEALNAFCRSLGVTRNENIIRYALLEHFVRDDLNRTAPRSMMVLNPLKVVITNFPEGQVEEVEALVRPDKDASAGVYKVPFSRIVYIEQSDFRLVDSKDYYGLCVGKTAMLRYAYPITVTDAIMAADGTTVQELRATYDASKSSKPKGVLHWVSCAPGTDPLKVEVRIYDTLFKSEDPNSLDKWLDDISQESEQVVQGALAVPPIANAKPGDKFQFERLGYFCVDTDSSPGKIVLNRTVTLRESTVKKTVVAAAKGK
eukprot:jgi/Mesvir1/14456/Mv11503-RA.2